MPTVTLTAREYNELRLRTALATAAARNGNPGACRGIPGRDNPAPETRINTGDSIRVSVTGELASARRGGRPAPPVRDATREQPAPPAGLPPAPTIPEHAARDRGTDAVK
jgi:hypothetical protein